MRVFIIDDDYLSLFITESMLHMESQILEVKCFLSALDALVELQSAGADLPGLIFLDLNMPSMDGWGFLDAVSSSLIPFNNKCAIYILTSSLDPADMYRAKEYSIVSGLIHKPIAEDDIRIALDEAFSLQTSTIQH